MPDIPTEMVAIDPDTPGGPEVLQPVTRPVPSPGPGEVLVRVVAAGVNRPEIMQRQGKYAPPPGAPTILGLELAGEVVAIGPTSDNDDRIGIGDRVCALVGGGAYAGYAVASAALCLPVPDEMSMMEAAAMPETLFTVWDNAFRRGCARSGETMLVHGGTSGIGMMAILLGRLFGVATIVTAGNAAKCASALANGADHAIDYRDRDFVEEVKRITGGRGVDLVLDMVGGDYLPRNLKCLAEDGRHVSIAIPRGAKAELPIWEVMTRRLVLTGSTLRARDLAFKATLAADVRAQVWRHVAAGRLRPVIDRTFPLAQAADAHRRVEAGDHVGKVVLTMDGASG